LQIYSFSFKGKEEDLFLSVPHEGWYFQLSQLKRLHCWLPPIRSNN